MGRGAAHAGQGRDRPRAAVPELRRAVAAPDEPPRALSLRVLPAPLRADLRVPQLRRALHDRAHVLHRDPQVQQLRRLHAPGRMSERYAAGLARRELLRDVRVAPSILSADFGAPARAGAGGARRGGAGDPRRRHGRALRAADHRRPADRGGARRPVHEAGGMLDVHLMIERPERQVEEFVKAGADSITFHAEATPHVAYTRELIRESGACVGPGDQPRHAGRGARGGGRRCSTWRCA